MSGWNPTLDGTNNGTNSAVYKGAALGVANGHNFLYVTNFHTGHVETYDETFQKVNPNGFADPNIPSGYAPFGIQNLDGQIFVTYAKQDSKKRDDVAGPGNGFVNVFDNGGNLIKRLVSNGNLNSPWGLALVEGDQLWVGNFGDGRINNYDQRPALPSERLTEPTELLFSSTACGPCFLSVPEFILPPVLPVRTTDSLA